MNKYINKISMCLCMGALALGAASCYTPDDVITSVKYDRLFSPTDVATRVRNRTSVEVTWATRNANVDRYTIELSTDENFSSVDHTVFALASPALIVDLDGETKYYVRVMASAEGEVDSKWSPTVNFTTDTENIYLAQQDGDIQASNVTLRWTAGQTVETIEVLDQDGAKVKSQAVSYEECVAGVATVTDLKGETTYTFVLKRNGKTRGSITLTTELDLDGAIKVTVDDDWYTMLKNAEAGSTFAFMPGEYAAYATESGEAFSNITFNNSVNLKAAKSSQKPVLKGFNIKIGDGASLELTNVILNGNDHADQAILTAAAGEIDHITISGTEICGFKKGVLYVNTATAIGTIDINHSYIHDINCEGGDGFDFRNGAAKVFTFTNNSIVNVATVGKRDLFRMDANGNKVVPAGTITITNNNFDNVSDASGKRVLYIRLGDTFPITFKNNVISNTQAIYTNQKTTKIAEMGSNNYFKAPGFFTPAETSGLQIDSSEHTEIDPKYNAEYLVTDEDLIFMGVGNF